MPRSRRGAGAPRPARAAMDDADALAAPAIPSRVRRRHASGSPVRAPSPAGWHGCRVVIAACSLGVFFAVAPQARPRRRAFAPAAAAFSSAAVTRRSRLVLALRVPDETRPRDAGMTPGHGRDDVGRVIRSASQTHSTRPAFVVLEGRPALRRRHRLETASRVGVGRSSVRQKVSTTTGGRTARTPPGRGSREDGDGLDVSESFLHPALEAFGRPCSSDHPGDLRSSLARRSTVLFTARRYRS